jgi:hypothetical protein
LEHHEKEFFERLLRGQEKLEHELKRGLERIDREFEHVNRKLNQIEREINQPKPITGFTTIQETNTMVPLAAGQTATFSTTPIPSTSVPVAASIVWTSSDAVAFPLAPNTADATGLSTLLTFPASTLGGVSFSLTVSYVNSDGTTATQTDSFTTVAPPSPDVTGFTPITQTA